MQKVYISSGPFVVREITSKLMTNYNVRNYIFHCQKQDALIRAKLKNKL